MCITRVDHWAYVSQTSWSSRRRAHASALNPTGLERWPGAYLAIEVLSQRSFQQQDLTNKRSSMQSWVSGILLADRQARSCGKAADQALGPGPDVETEQDPDGGVTSDLRFPSDH